ncbi:DNA methylase [Helicobacter sp. MIT 01-3238]|nr:DNA methylase [Helicobacter sp. MIT 01-3238]
MLQNPALKAEFFTHIDSALVFQKERFLDFLKLRILDSSYTKFANKIGLSLHSDLLKNALLKGQAKVALNFPYKDCVLKGAQSKDSDKSDEIFFNEILASDEIDILFKPKALQNFKLISKGQEANDFESIKSALQNRRSIFDEKSGLCSHEQGNKTKASIDEASGKLHDLSQKDKPSTPNLLIKGNNLLALHTLKSRRDIYGQVKLIYIDPPYNTGNDSFNYNDRFNHSAWLVFMKNRLEIAREFLREDGVIFIQCDDNEQAYLKVLCDEIFGRENFVGCIVWRKKTGGGQDSVNFAREHEYILCYKRTNWQIIDSKENQDENEFNKIINGKKAKILKLEKWGIGALREDAPSLYYPIKDPNGNDFYPIAPNGTEGRWRKKPENLDNEHIYWQESKGRLTPYEVLYFDELQDKLKIIKTRTIWLESGNTTQATKEMKALFADSNADLFSTPKPEALLKRIIEISTKEGDLVMDFFAGSGTTCAVAHKMNRRWIGIEQMDYVEGITKERLIKVINGEQGGISKAVGWNPLSPSLAEGDKGGWLSSQSKDEASKKDADSTHPLAPSAREGELPKNAFIYCELMPLNALYKDKITKSSSEGELAQIYNELQTKAFIDYRVDIKEMLKDRDFEALPLADKKQILYAILDSNMDYVAYSDIQDSNFCVDKEVQELNRAFYKGGENG